MFEFRLPDVGEGLHEAEISQWHVGEGEMVGQDQPLLDVETDKAAVEIPSPVAGIVRRIAFRPGEMAKVGEVLVTIETADGRKSPAKPAEPKAEPVAAPAAVEKSKKRIVASPVARKMARELGVDLVTVKGSGPAGRIMTNDVKAAAESPPVEATVAPTPIATTPSASGPVLALPMARKRAVELGVDIGRVVGTGKGGHITVDDVEMAASGSSLPAIEAVEEPTLAPTVRHTVITGQENTIRVPLRGLRRRIAQRMEEAWRVPHVSSFDHADATELVALRRSLKPLAEAQGVKLTYLPILAKIMAHLLREFPNFNASLDMEQELILQHQHIHLGIAAAIPDGLVVPVLKHADQLTILELAAEIERLGTLARARKLEVDALRGSTLTISNYGSFGGWLATPIINPPEVAIVGFGRMNKQAVVVDDEVVARQRLPIALSFDHRIIDGADSGAFMRRLVALIENPQALLLELS